VTAASVLILLLALIAGIAIYVALFASFEAIERSAADRFDSRTVSGFVALVVALNVASLAVAGVA
jgi:archaellum component FlaF (FlaF/FlaG flagellin family)